MSKRKKFVKGSLTGLNAVLIERASSDPYLCSLCWQPVWRETFVARHDGALAHVRCYALTFGRAALQIPEPPPLAPLRGETVYSGGL